MGCIILQSPAAPAGSAASPVRVDTKVSDVIVSTLPGGPEMVGVLDSARSQQSGHYSFSVRPYHQDRCILLGWGATWMARRRGRWSVEEAEQHVNCLELKAPILALKAFLRVGMQPPPQSLDHHPPRHILWKCTIKQPPPMGTGGEGHSVTISVHTSLGTVILPADPRFMDSPLLTGSVECGSRCSLEGIQHSLQDIAHHFYVS